MTPLEYGLTDAIAAEIIGMARSPERPRRLNAAERAGLAGQAGQRLEITSSSNAYAARHAFALHDLFTAGDCDGLASYLIGGSNCYSKILRAYRDGLIEACLARSGVIIE